MSNVHGDFTMERDWPVTVRSNALAQPTAIDEVHVGRDLIRM